ncbi:MAG TPA: hypothetical protein VGN38_12180 [Caulobacteraceae bacterium]|nr:hypothetical protein [Caulobacteraceae bacterium]
MRAFHLAASAALLCVGVAGAAHAQPATCPPSSRGPGSVATYYYLPADPIINTDRGLKPAPMSAKGVCIDPAGDIHLYLADVNYVDLTFKIDPRIGKFDANDQDDAFTAPGQDFWWSTFVTPDGTTLTVNLTAMGDKSYHKYFMHYLDPNGHRRKIEPGIHDH